MPPQIASFGLFVAGSVLIANFHGLAAVTLLRRQEFIVAVPELVVVARLNLPHHLQARLYQRTVSAGNQSDTVL